MIDYTTWVTIVDVCRLMKVEPTNELTWSVGNVVRDMWEDEHGELPRKALREKTAGGGSHCFALYPPEWIPRIEKVIRAHGAPDENQLTFDL